MIIHIEGFDKTNNYINKNIYPKNKKIKELGKWANYDWYKDGIQLSCEYNEWENNNNYEIIFNNELINLYIKINNKIIMTPLICKKITVEVLKNILSIKDNIYFKHILLKDKKTLEHYNINNMDSLIINAYSSSALECA
jgi:hypothetical protein